MLWRILEAHLFSLPKDVHVLFANTGKEREETLRFVRDCSERWEVPIVWVEHGGVGEPRNRIIVREVAFESASRNGEPFEYLLRHRGYLPGSGLRFCTTELKIRVMKWWMVARGYDEWVNVVGLRADEPDRVRRALEPKPERWENECPLASAGVTVADVAEFWSRQPFDLALRSDEGNCDLCYMKNPAKRARLIRERPQSADWWIEQERWAHERGAESDQWRRHEPRYADLRDAALLPPERLTPRWRAILSVQDEAPACGCTD